MTLSVAPTPPVGAFFQVTRAYPYRLHGSGARSGRLNALLGVELAGGGLLAAHDVVPRISGRVDPMCASSKSHPARHPRYKSARPMPTLLPRRPTKNCPRPMIHGFATTQIGTIVHKFVGGLQT
jgi:hypothetical protein